MQVKQLVILLAVFAVALTACSGGSRGVTESTEAPTLVPGDPIAGIDVYKGACRNCHGSDLQGVSGLGKPLAPSTYVVVHTEEQLAAFIAIGRPVGDPDNTQGVAMPPKGGNPSLDAQDLLDVAAYLKAQN